MKDKKEQIIKLLEEKGILSTTAIAEGTRSNIHITKDRLNELEDKLEVERILTPRYLYWKLR